MALRFAIVVFGWSAVVVAQAVQGSVRGFTGEPAAEVVLNVLDDRGMHVADTTTGKDGRYRMPSTGGAKVRAWLEGVVLTLPLAREAVDFDFQGAKYFTLRGHVVDPEGKPIADLELFCQDTEGWLATGKTDAAGAFLVRSNQTVDHLLVDPHGWRHRVAGPYEQDRGIAVDLRLEKSFFLLQGQLLDERGQAVVGADLTAGAARQNIRSTVTDAVGKWRLWCNRPVTSLFWQAGNRAQHTVQGEWDKAAVVPIDFRACGFVVVSGRVLDAAGKPAAGARVVPLEQRNVQRHLPEPIATTAADGTFRALVPGWARRLVTWVAEQPVYVDGPWTKDAEVELRAGR